MNIDYRYQYIWKSQDVQSIAIALRILKTILNKHNNGSPYCHGRVTYHSKKLETT